MVVCGCCGGRESDLWSLQLAALVPAVVVAMMVAVLVGGLDG